LKEFRPSLERLLTISVQGDDEPFPVKLSDESFETYNLDPPPYTLDTTKKELKKMYYDMVAVR
jgi:pyruvate dehydrogenase E1 component alpha subunit